MGKWNKMAEAFGRALHNATSASEHAALNPSAQRKAYAKDKREFNKFYDSAKNADAEDEFRQGWISEELASEKPYQVKVESGEFVEPDDVLQASREQAEFDKVFDAHVKDAADFHGGFAKYPGGRAQVESDFRRKAIDMLKNPETDISDVLDYLRPYRTFSQPDLLDVR